MQRMATVPNCVPGHQSGPVTSMPLARQGANRVVVLIACFRAWAFPDPALLEPPEPPARPGRLVQDLSRCCHLKPALSEPLMAGGCPAQRWPQCDTRQSHAGLQAPKADGKEINLISPLAKYPGLAPGMGSDRQV